MLPLPELAMLITVTATPHYKQTPLPLQAKHYASNGSNLRTVIGELVITTMDEVMINAIGFPDSYTVVVSFETTF